MAQWANTCSISHTADWAWLPGLGFKSQVARILPVNIISCFGMHAIGLISRSGTEGLLMRVLVNLWWPLHLIKLTEMLEL